MRVFVTGASGFIGSAVVSELISAGHQVLGLARSEASAAVIAATGAAVHRGDLDDLESLKAGATATDGVIHLGYNHDFSQPLAAVQTDLHAIETLGTALKGSDRPLLIASGVLGRTNEKVILDPSSHPRVVNAQTALGFAFQGVRSMVMGFAPTVHGKGDHGFMAALIRIARAKGVSGYINDGKNHWPAIHRLDAARLCRLALEKAPAASVLHAVAEEGVTIRSIAEVIGRHLNLPTVSISSDQASEHFGFLSRFLATDSQTSSAVTRELLDWQPTNVGLIDDLEQGHYFA